MSLYQDLIDQIANVCYAEKLTKRSSDIVLLRLLSFSA